MPYKYSLFPGVFNYHKIIKGLITGVHHNGCGPFLDNNNNYASPLLTSLRKLEQASLALEKECAEKVGLYAQHFDGALTLNAAES